MINYEDLERLKKISSKIWEKDGRALTELAGNYFRKHNEILNEFVTKCIEKEIDPDLIIATLLAEIKWMINNLSEIEPSFKESIAIALKYGEIDSIEKLIEKIKEDSKGYV